MEVALKPQTSVAERRQLSVGEHGYATIHLQTVIFSFCCKLLASVSHASSHSNELCLLLNPLHIMFKYLSM